MYLAEVFQNVRFFNETKTNWWEIIIPSLLPLLLTWFISRKIDKKNQKFQEEMNEKNKEFELKLELRNQDFLERMQAKEIDASIISSARIEWIQSVRNETKNFIVEYIKLAKRETDSVWNFKQSVYQLILYFGNNTTDKRLIYFNQVNNKIVYSDGEILKKLNDSMREDNSDLNDVIVDLIRCLDKSITKYTETKGYDGYLIDNYTLEMLTKYKAESFYLDKESDYDLLDPMEKSEETFDQYEQKLAYDWITFWENEVCEKDDNRALHFGRLTEYFDKKEEEIDKQSKENDSAKKQLPKDLDYFIKVMRIYLKVEWKNISNIK